MASYLVTWKIDIDADSHREAAEQARMLQLNPESLAVVYEVQQTGPVKRTHSVEIDLLAEEKR